MNLLKAALRNLYFQTSQLNLYIYLHNEKDCLDITRLKEEIKNIKRIISTVEIEINKL